MASSVPGPLPLPESRYDLSTYMGRVYHCAEISDPTMLFTTSKQLEDAKNLISDYRNGRVTEVSEQFWTAKKILDSTVHPDTGETVVLPFRMSSCVLSNLVVTAGMLTPGLGTAGTLFWQIANQSLNVAVNYSNANKSHPLSTTQLIQNYAIAVTSSCGVALGLNAIVPRLRNVSPNTKMILGRLVPFAAVVSAGIVNVFAMRSQEIKKGISVFDKDGNEVGKSKTAAVYAVGETAASRVINATPIMVIPPLILVRLQRGFLKGKGLGIQTLVNLGLIAATSFIALPFALAIFPQYQGIDIHRLESDLAGKKDKNGDIIDKVYFNRGI
ncbi:FSF1 [Cyberlindnera jadinii]|uniref:Sidoreflexin n=1 Tax=Cyberlindnera jadinii (strain ATCC 18201 / CBS 1600 / BCRC 20928 / JCM 3617 / NBRC 0987 / NRRL Y-1542) TaxID=983966 RepID=A0A0H5CJF8_CYBJN|nr:Tricarboxylate/iron carrier [Cyberlindnera jadinii NRRL Y-1542]ODV72613.1 Tricarboxylate/iron carrier [Cyberlindnera jadinii NRRL Y-1542]CEP24664.1 FSF1 [Cyberlindnera jadinii]